MRYIIAGGREFSDYALMESSLKNIMIDEVVSGGASGADNLGERYAKDHRLELTVFPAEWDKYGRSAGYRRNAKMAEYADALVAFWDGESKGTKHMIDIALEKGMWIKVVRYTKKG